MTVHMFMNPPIGKATRAMPHDRCRQSAHLPSLGREPVKVDNPLKSVVHASATPELHRESKKTRHQAIGHNFTNYYPIFKIFSLADSVVNLQQIHA